MVATRARASSGVFPNSTWRATRRSIRSLSSLATNQTASHHLAGPCPVRMLRGRRQLPSVTTSRADGSTTSAAASGCSSVRSKPGTYTGSPTCLFHPLKQMRVASGVEGVRGALAAACADPPVELGVGQVEAVHRNMRHPVGALDHPDALQQQVDEGRLPRSGVARDAEDRPRLTDERDRIAGQQIRCGHLAGVRSPTRRLRRDYSPCAPCGASGHR